MSAIFKVKISLNDGNMFILTNKRDIIIKMLDNEWTPVKDDMMVVLHILAFIFDTIFYCCSTITYVFSSNATL